MIATLWIFLALAALARADENSDCNAIRKSWAKMTEAARAEALNLNYGTREMELIQRALAPA